MVRVASGIPGDREMERQRLEVEFKVCLGKRELNKKKELAQKDSAAVCQDGWPFCFLSYGIFLALAFPWIKLCGRVSLWLEADPSDIEAESGSGRRQGLEGHSLQQELVWSLGGWLWAMSWPTSKKQACKVFQFQGAALGAPMRKPNYSWGEPNSVWVRVLGCQSHSCNQGTSSQETTNKGQAGLKQTNKGRVWRGRELQESWERLPTHSPAEGGLGKYTLVSLLVCPLLPVTFHWPTLSQKPEAKMSIDVVHTGQHLRAKYREWIWNIQHSGKSYRMTSSQKGLITSLPPH